VSAGTPKRFIKRLLKEKVLTDKHLLEIQNILDRFEVPREVGRIPRKIAANFSSLNAEEWKLWTVYFSVFCFQQIKLDSKVVELWALYARAVTLLCKPLITRADISEADKLLLAFCKGFESMFGASAVSMNMHMHLHLPTMLEDYGPVHSFWCFAFERLNGTLGSFPTNNRAIEPQVMRQFQRSISVEQRAATFVLANPDFKESAAALPAERLARGTPSAPTWSAKQLQSYNRAIHDVKDVPTGAEDFPGSLVGPFTESRLTDAGFGDLKTYYERAGVRSDEKQSLTFSQWISKCKRLQLCGQTFGAVDTRSHRSSYVLARFAHAADGNADETALYCARVLYYFTNSVCAQNRLGQQRFVRYTFAFVEWFTGSTAVAGTDALKVSSCPSACNTAFLAVQG